MEKNFDELENDCWYLSNCGSVVKVKIFCDTPPRKTFTDVFGRVYSREGDEVNDISAYDLITKIASPDLTPLPKPKKKVKKWQWVFKPAGTCNVYQITKGRYENEHALRCSLQFQIIDCARIEPSEIEEEV